MRRIGCVRCEKFRCDFIANSWALIAPFQPVLHWVLSINETLPNAPQHYEINKNMSLGFNWVERVRSFWKILTWLQGSNLCLNSIILAQFCIGFRVVMKQSKMHPNTTNRTKTWVHGPMGRIGCLCCQKFRCDFVARTIALIALVQSILDRVSGSNETIQNAPKHYEMYRIMNLRSNGLDRVCSLRKISDATS